MKMKSGCGGRSTTENSEAGGYLQVPGMNGWEKCQLGEGKNHEDRYGKSNICNAQVSSEQL